MKLLLVCLALLSITPLLQSQAIPAAIKEGDLKVGAGLVLAHPDYSPQNEAGFGIFANFDILKHYGVEFQFHQVGGSATNNISEKTYELGGRFLWTFHPYLPVVGRHDITPFLKFDGGVGSFHYGNSYQNGTYGLYAGGGGVDYNVIRKVDARIEYEYQRWASFVPNGLQPNLLTIGVAYNIR